MVWVQEMFGWVDGMAWKVEWTPSVIDTLHSLNYIVLIQLSLFYVGVPLPDRSILGKNQSTLRETPARCKGVFPLRSGGGSFIGSHSDICSCFIPFVLAENLKGGMGMCVCVQLFSPFFKAY